MNKTTQLKFSQIMTKASDSITNAAETGVNPSISQFNTILELLILILDRIDEVEEAR